MRPSRLLLVLWFSLGAACLPAAAQDTTPDPAPTFSPASAPMQVAPGQAELQAAVAEAQAAAASARDAAERTDQGVNVASSLLGIFEALGFLVTVVGGGAALFGVSRLFSAERELARTREDVQKELAEVLEKFNAATDKQRADLTKLEQELQQSRENSSRAMAFLMLGERQYRASDRSGAIKSYQEALALDPYNPIIHYRLGYVCVHSKDLASARQHLEDALSLNHEFPPALAARGFTKRRQAELLPEGSIERDQLMNEAETDLLSALSLVPSLIDEDGESWWGSLGGLYRLQRNLVKALTYYERAGQVTPQSSYPFGNLALLQLQLGNIDDLPKTYLRIEKLALAETNASVDNHWAFNDLLTARLVLGRAEAAEEALLSVIETTPKGSEGVSPLEALVNTLRQLAAALGSEANTRFAPFIARIEGEIERHKQDKTQTA